MSDNIRSDPLALTSDHRGIEFTDEELAKARYAMLFRFVSRSDVSAVDEQDFNAR